LARSSQQDRPTPRHDDELRLAIIRRAKQYGRYGDRKVTKLLHWEGWKVNYKKVERIWREKVSSFRSATKAASGPIPRVARSSA
jgi:hypothetical protein